MNSWPNWNRLLYLFKIQFDQVVSDCRFLFTDIYEFWFDEYLLVFCNFLVEYNTAPRAKHHFRSFYFAAVQEIDQLFLRIWVYHLKLFSIVQHVYTFDLRFRGFYDFNHHDVGRFKEILFFDLQRVGVNLHRWFAFFFKLQFSVI